jgi:hypothetical protein
MPDRPRNMGASVRARLLNLARQRNQPFELLLTRYVLERLLYRLASTTYRDRFVLKGAMLMAAWFDDPLRPTRDIDLLGFGDPEPDAVLAIFREICGVAEDDGVLFDADALAVERIRDELEYGGLRIKTDATVDGARIRVVIDVGFGDAVEAAEMELPVLLDLPPPKLRAYPRESVIAEKFHAMVLLGRANSRMKDFHDIWVLSRSHDFTGDALANAIAATFTRRKTEIPVQAPDALTQAFAGDPAKQQQWTAFLQGIEAKPVPIADIVADLAAFLMPHAEAARKGGRNSG